MAQAVHELPVNRYVPVKAEGPAEGAVSTVP